jgi:uncharacterized protein YjbI with pentapeptide repeats
MREIIKIIGYCVSVILFLFTAFQVYLGRSTGAVSTKGLAWQLSDPKTLNDAAIKWALTELAPCYDLDNFYYLPKSEYSADYHDIKLKLKQNEFINIFIQEYSGKWLQCRSRSFSFSGSVIQDFSFIDGLFCPKNSNERQSIIDLLEYRRKSLVVSNSYLLCVSFSNSRLSKMNSDRSAYIGSSFLLSDLSSSEWKSSDLRYAIFDLANLEGALFANGTNLQGASFEGANLCGAKFDGTTIVGTENFSGANVSKADLAGLSGLTEKQLSQFCVQADNASPTLPRHLANRGSLIRKCTKDELQQIRQRFPESKC